MGLVIVLHILPANAQDLIIDVVSKFEGNLTVSSGTLTLRVYDSFGTDVTNTVDVFFEYYAKQNCGQPVKNTITYPFGVSNPDPIKVTISNLTEGVYFYRLKAVSGSLSAYTQWFRLGIVKKDNTLPVASVTTTSIDTVRDANLKTVPELKLSGTATDDCTDTVSIYWEKISGPAATLVDDFKGNLTLKDVAEGDYVFNMVAKDDRGGITRVAVTVIVRPPPVPPPPPTLTVMKAFSPNQDSIDDWWKVTGISALTDVSEVQLINQFGQPMGSLKPPFIDDEVWDGNQFGKPMPEGAYYFIIKDKNKQEIKRGSILLVR
jgi:gliding motility-associated-like protein